MTSRDDRADAHTDAALEALARQAPPREHVERVLARTSAGSLRPPGGSVGRDNAPRRRADLAGYLRPRWLVPLAAAAVVALGVSWNVSRTEVALPAVAKTDGLATQPQTTPWGALQDIERPVLPPQAYWAMDPFAEFATLPPGAFEAVGLPNRSRAASTRREADEPAMAWVPVPTGLPPIELADIAPVSIEMAPLAPLEAIAPAAIPLAPIVIAPFTAEERP